MFRSHFMSLQFAFAQKVISSLAIVCPPIPGSYRPALANLGLSAIMAGTALNVVFGENPPQRVNPYKPRLRVLAVGASFNLHFLSLLFSAAAK